MFFDAATRALAHEVVDALFDHVERIESRPVVGWHSPDDLRAGLGGPTAMECVRQLLDNSIQLHHPAYMGHQVCPPFPAAVIADMVISTLNQSTAVWEMSPIGTVIEQEIVRWLADRAGYPAAALGTAVSGGSAANLTALLAARAKYPDRRVVVCGADTHYSVARAAAIMGAEAVSVPTNAAHRMDVDALSAYLEDVKPMAIVATSGSTATGSFDDLRAIAALRDRHDTWLHVDAAHGASVLLSPSLKHLVEGLDRADSFSWDPHKMMWMPLSLGAVLVRDGVWLRRAFAADAPYLFHGTGNIGEITIQCSKRADAIKLWLTLQIAGTEPIVRALDHVTAITRYLYEHVRASDDFEAMHEPEFNIFCFRHRGGDNARLRDAVIRSGEAWITSTLLKGERVLRVTMINPRTQRDHVDAMLDLIRSLAPRSGERVAPQAPGEGR